MAAKGAGGNSGAALFCAIGMGRHHLTTFWRKDCSKDGKAQVRARFLSLMVAL